MKKSDKMRNELGIEVPLEILDNAKKNGCIKDGLYVYKDGQYGVKIFPASSIGGTKATRFGNMQSVEANKIELGDGWVAFRSPTHGGINIFGDFIPYRH